MKSHSPREDPYFRVRGKQKTKKQNKILAASNPKDQNHVRKVLTL